MKKGAEGARCEAHLNSQAKGPLLDRTLESFLVNTEGVISYNLEITSRQKTESCDFLFRRKNLSGQKTE